MTPASAIDTQPGTPVVPSPSPVRAVLLREIRAALMNRYFQVFTVLALGGGFVTYATTDSTRAAGFILLQVALYFVSLFAMLVGTSSARAEAEEWPILFAQPVPRAVYVWGKFIALLGIFAVLVAVLFAPVVIPATPEDAAALAPLYFQTLLVAAVFGALGLAAGFYARDRVQGLILGVAAWLVLLFGVDLVGLIAARLPLVQKAPDVWVASLMCNPLDAFRIQALFAMEQVPTEGADKTPLAHWWITHAGAWFATISTVWTALLLFFTTRHLKHWEE